MITKGLGTNTLITRGLGWIAEGWKQIVRFTLNVKRLVLFPLER